jgi:hypothetical protein
MEDTMEEQDPAELYAVPEDQRVEFDEDDEDGVADRNPETTLEDDLILAESFDDGEIHYYEGDE